jgi:protein SCO1/2
MHSAIQIRAGLVLCAALFVCAGAGRALADDALPGALEGISIEHQPGAQVSPTLEFTDHTGRRVHFEEVFRTGKPVILVLGYYRCPMLCSLVFSALIESVKALPLVAGRDFEVVSLSIDPRDDAKSAAEKRDGYLKSLGVSNTSPNWQFWTGDSVSTRRVADAVGFHYRWDEATEQFAHAAGLFVLTPDGRVSRTLFGVHFEPDTLKFALIEASAGRVGKFVDQVLLFCFHYDPTQGSYVLAAGRLMRLGGVITLVLLGAGLAQLFRRDRRAMRAVLEHSR